MRIHRLTSVCLLIFVLTGCGGGKTTPLPSSGTPNAMPSISKPLAKPGDELEGVQSQSNAIFDEDNNRLAVLSVVWGGGEMEEGLLKEIEPFQIYDSGSQNKAVETIKDLKVRYPSRTAQEVLKRLEEMLTCKEEQIGFMVRAGKQEVVFSKGAAPSKDDWEIVDLSRRASNVAGSFGTEHPEDALALLQSAPTAGASPKFIGFLERTRQSCEEKVAAKKALEKASN